MDYKQPIKATISVGYQNLSELIIVSLGITLTLIPLVITGLVGTSLTVLGGLWVTCLLLGISVVAAFRYTTTITDRGVSIDLWPTIVPVLKDPMLGLKVGTITFSVLVVTILGLLLAPEVYRSIVVGIATFLLVLWYLVVAFATPELGTDQGLISALRSSSVRLGESPESAIVFLVLTFTCTFITGVTVITIGLFLPGLLALLAAQMTTAVNGGVNQ